MRMLCNNPHCIQNAGRIGEVIDFRSIAIDSDPLVGATPASRSTRGVEEFIRLRRIATQASPLHFRRPLAGVINMTHRLVLPLVVIFASTTLAQPVPGPTKITIDENFVLVINGKKIFPIGFTIIPPPDAKAPSGKLAMEEWRAGGGTFIRTGPMKEDNWDKGWMEQEK